MQTKRVSDSAENRSIRRRIESSPPMADDVVISRPSLMDGGPSTESDNAHRWDNGTIYTGEWVDGKPHGNGKAVFPMNCTYDGQWEKGYYHGFGIMRYTDDTTYIGQWAYGLTHGLGTKTFPNSGHYHGDFSRGLREGKGVMTCFGDGGVYIGEWKNDKRNGKGTFNFFKGASYTGDWKDGKVSGHGKFTLARRVNLEEIVGGVTIDATESDIIAFEGSFLNGFISGKCSIIYANGDIATHHWVAGKRSGWAKTLLKSGTIRYGISFKSVPWGNQIEVTPSGNKIICRFNGNEKMVLPYDEFQATSFIEMVERALDG